MVAFRYFRIRFLETFVEYDEQNEKFSNFVHYDERILQKSATKAIARIADYCFINKVRLSIRRIPAAEPLHLLLVGHVEIARFLVQGANLSHLHVGKCEVDDIDVLFDEIRVGIRLTKTIAWVGLMT